MTFDEFINKYTGQAVDFDNVYPNQCMDLMHQYIYEVLGITDKSVLAAPSAYQAYTNNYPQYFDKIDNTPTGIPQKGDIVFFDQSIGQWGHVCIFLSGGASRFTSFDANWPTGSLPHQQSHNYNGCLGWLRYKQPLESTTAPSGSNFQSVEQIIIDSYMVICGEGPTDDEKKYRLDNWTNTTDFLKSLMGDSRFTKLYIDPVVKEKDDEILHLKDSIQAEYLKDTDFGEQLHATQKEVEDLTIEVAAGQKEIARLQGLLNVKPTVPLPSVATKKWLTKLLDFLKGVR